MIYVMSDLHGCYDKYIFMIKKIELKAEDALYILGDILDRGPNGFKIALDIAKRENVVLLRGNHDQQAAILLSNLYLLQDDEMADKYAPIFSAWLSDGGDSTMREFLELSEKEQKCALNVIINSLVSKEIKIKDINYILAHTVPGIENVNEYDKWTLDDYILGETDYEEVYFKDKIIITGHTPTGLIDPESKGKIWKRNKHIAIDCGAVFGFGLGCLCLDTLEEFYV